MIERLVDCKGVAGLETEVRICIEKELNEMKVDHWVDSMGNLHAEKNIKENDAVILTAYMDEPGLIVTQITQEGYLKFEIVGGVKPEFLVSKRVCVGERMGIVARKAIHLLSKKEREDSVKTEQLMIDIGAKSFEEASAMVEVGDYISFDTRYGELEGRCFKGSALAGRLGCFVALSLLKKPDIDNLHVIFAAQREIQNRGMIPAVRGLCGRYAIVLDGTDGRLWDFEKEMAELGKGPVLFSRTGAGAMDETLCETVRRIATETKIGIQNLCTKRTGAEVVLQKNGENIRCICFGFPVRYMASPMQIACLDDAAKLEKILTVLLTAKEEGK